MAFGRIWSRYSTSSAVFSLPKLKRIAPRASSSLRPRARMTGDGSRLPDEHAEPVETAMPCISRLMSKPSPSMKRNEIFEIFGRRFSRSPLKIKSSIFSPIADSNLSRKASKFSAEFFKFVFASSQAFPKAFAFLVSADILFVKPHATPNVKCADTFWRVDFMRRN